MDNFTSNSNSNGIAGIAANHFMTDPSTEYESINGERQRIVVDYQTQEASRQNTDAMHRRNENVSNAMRNPVETAINAYSDEYSFSHASLRNASDMPFRKSIYGAIEESKGVLGSEVSQPRSQKGRFTLVPVSNDNITNNVQVITDAATMNTFSFDAERHIAQDDNSTFDGTSRLSTDAVSQAKPLVFDMREKIESKVSFDNTLTEASDHSLNDSFSIKEYDGERHLYGVHVIQTQNNLASTTDDFSMNMHNNHQHSASQPVPSMLGPIVSTSQQLNSDTHLSEQVENINLASSNQAATPEMKYVSNSSREPYIVPSSASLPPATVVGMVGNTPIVRMQGTTGLVKKKKGRFKLLQPATDGIVTDIALSSEVMNASMYDSKSTNAEASKTAECIDALPLRNAPPAVESVPKQKGRFVITSVNSDITASQLSSVSTGGPISLESLSTSNLTDNASTSQLPETTKPSPIVSTITAPVNHNLSHQVLYESTHVTNPPNIQSNINHLTIPLSNETLREHPAEASLVGNAYKAVQVASNTTGSLLNPAVQFMPPAQSNRSPESAVAYEEMNANVNIETSKAPDAVPDPLGTSLETSDLTTDDNSTRKSETRTRPPQGSKERKHYSVPKVARQSPSGSMGQAGLGKVFYFLDQMRLEVSGADRTIKTLQIDMKCLVSIIIYLCLLLQ
jgi:hypothetical protein